MKAIEKNKSFYNVFFIVLSSFLYAMIGLLYELEAT